MKRHTVAWSYDLLNDAEKSLLTRCSVFSGGFDLESACAVEGSNASDDYAVLNLLDALVRKSLLVVDQSSGRTRYSMLETIRQFAEEQLVTFGAAHEARAAHAHGADEEDAVALEWTALDLVGVVGRRGDAEAGRMARSFLASQPALQEVHALA